MTKGAVDTQLGHLSITYIPIGGIHCNAWCEVTQVSFVAGHLVCEVSEQIRHTPFSLASAMSYMFYIWTKNISKQRSTNAQMRMLISALLSFTGFLKTRFKLQRNTRSHMVVN